MKKFLVSCFFGGILFLHGIMLFANGENATLYYGQGCPHCAQVEEYLDKNKSSLPLKIIGKEVYQNKANAEEFNTVCSKEGIDLMERGVPFLYSEGQCFIGDTPIIQYLESKKQKEIPLSNQTGSTTEKIEKNTPPSQSLTLPILIGAALVDSINPCEFAVLLILMTTILASGNRRRALFSGLAYSLSIFISYFLMGLGLYSVIAHMGTPATFMRVIGGVAILLGLFNLKDFFWYGKFFVMEVPMSWRPKLKALVRSITGPISAFLIGFLVSIFLLPCTSGPYIVILGMLGHNETYIQAILLLLLYNFIFVLPMIGLTIAVYFGMNVEKAEETRSKNLKILHLIAGIIMLLMGIALILGM